MTECDYLRRRDGLTSTLLPDGYLIIVDDSQNQATTLNPLGAVIWEFCDGSHSINSIVAELVALSTTDNDDSIRAGVENLVGELKRSGLLI